MIDVGYTYDAGVDHLWVEVQNRRDGLMSGDTWTLTGLTCDGQERVATVQVKSMQPDHPFTHGEAEVSGRLGTKDGAVLARFHDRTVL